MTLDLDGIKDAIEAGINGDDRFRDTRGEALSALAVLIAEVGRLRGEVDEGRVRAASADENGARKAAYASGALDGQDTERAAVVAWLRERQEAAEWALTAAGYEHAADIIERGEHRREEKT